MEPWLEESEHRRGSGEWFEAEVHPICHGVPKRMDQLARELPEAADGDLSHARVLWLEHRAR